MDPVAKSYDDFIPLSRRITKEGVDTIVIELPEFKKEHLRIQLDNDGNLRISGERPTDGDQWKSFLMEFRVPDNCNASEISAKFESGLLTITLPKRIAEVEPEPEPEPEPEKMKQPETDLANKESGNGVSEKLEDKVEEGESGLMVGMKRKRKQLMINFAVAAVIMIGVGIFVDYKIRKIIRG